MVDRQRSYCSKVCDLPFKQPTKRCGSAPTIRAFGDTNPSSQIHNWTVTNKGLYYQHEYNSHQRINYYDFDTQNISSLVKLPNQSLARLEHPLLF
jgi:hypothetical protein